MPPCLKPPSPLDTSSNFPVGLYTSAPDSTGYSQQAVRGPVIPQLAQEIESHHTGLSCPM